MEKMNESEKQLEKINAQMKWDSYFADENKDSVYDIMRSSFVEL